MLLERREDLSHFASRGGPFDPTRLDEPSGKGVYTYRDLIHGIVLHDTYHAGQIQMLKRLHASLHRT